MGITRNMEETTTFLPFYHKKMLRAISEDRKITMSRLISFAVDNELQKKKPFEFDVSFPVEDYVKHTYIDEAGKILKYVGTLKKETGLDSLLLLRYEIGVIDKRKFLLAFRELLYANMLVPYKPKRRPNYSCADNYVCYRPIGTEPQNNKRTLREGKEYARYLRLKNKFGSKKIWMTTL